MLSKSAKERREIEAALPIKNSLCFLQLERSNSLARTRGLTTGFPFVARRRVDAIGRRGTFFRE